MKPLTALFAGAVLGLTACDTMHSPMSSTEYDPLLPPGGGIKMSDSQPGLRAGDHVRALMDSTTFFKQLPKGDADADKILARDTQMKIIRVADNYLQVELDNTGEVGYVPTIMVENTNAQPVDIPRSPGEYQVYPPLPARDPAAVPPEGAIPTVIDPDAPARSAPGTNAGPVPPIEPSSELPVPPTR
jgi:hypothetical protein